MKRRMVDSAWSILAVAGVGRLDVLFSNGDTIDPPFPLKPYHGIGWLENQGRFPFVLHPIAPMYAMHRAVAADFRGCGRPDIVAVSYLPPDRFPQRQQRHLDALIYLEQTVPGRFVRHSLEAASCDHVTRSAGDIFDTGGVDLATGNFLYRSSEQAITIWKNEGPAGIKA